jgi:hypothetical protein
MIHAVNQIASSLQALMKTREVVSDIYLIDAYHNYFLCSHFAWLQKGDPELGNKEAEFRNRHIAVRYFLMHQELTATYNLQGWKTMDAFQQFCDSMEDMNEQTKNKQVLKCNCFLMLARRALIKHFKVWTNEFLFLAVFGEAPTGRIVAKYLSPSDNTTAAVAPAPPNDMQLFDSPIHNRQIDLLKFKTFITKHCKIRDPLRAGAHVFPQRIPIKYFADHTIGEIWDDDAPLVLSRLKQHYMKSYAALPSNTQISPSPT